MITSSMCSTGLNLTFVIVHGIGLFLTRWLKLLGQVLPWLQQIGRSEAKAYCTLTLPRGQGFSMMD